MASKEKKLVAIYDKTHREIKAQAAWAGVSLIDFTDQILRMGLAAWMGNLGSVKTIETPEKKNVPILILDDEELTESQDWKIEDPEERWRIHTGWMSSAMRKAAEARGDKERLAKDPKFVVRGQVEEEEHK